MGYLLLDVGFGKIYSSNGNATSEYFKNQTIELFANFDTLYPSLSIPEYLYDSFFGLFGDAFKDLKCESFGIGCALHDSCDKYSSEFSGFYFRLQFFAYETNTPYTYVPMSTYLTQDSATGKCNFMITSNKLNSIIFGGMFFEEFYAEFKTDAKDLALGKNAYISVSKSS